MVITERTKAIKFPGDKLYKPICHADDQVHNTTLLLKHHTERSSDNAFALNLLCFSSLKCGGKKQNNKKIYIKDASLKFTAFRDQTDIEM